MQIAPSFEIMNPSTLYHLFMSAVHMVIYADETIYFLSLSEQFHTENERQELRNSSPATPASLS